MMPIHRRFFLLVAVAAIPSTAFATQAKIDTETCAQLRLEQIKFRQSGILDDMQKGPEWAKANLAPDRLREVEHYVMLDEQVKFGCRDAKLSPDAEKAAEAAARIEINSDADPTAPLDLTPEANGGGGPAVDPKAPKLSPAANQLAKKRTTHKKPKALSPDAFNSGGVTAPVAQDMAAPPVAAAPAAAAAAGPSPASPALGFGETMILSPLSP